ncbi:MAG: 50S ribosomal protein L15 [Candidatus Yanofskybacteria bacterium CG10_big_fil_rev_8_21_14_0_10_36_16]|uniref:Large ribosomal subunit protein uL15 n=1 Tax=Candidatus Yanofskybacteria bacterium CG10_big_fil_rev_8_21_14_0_10_36_16 TaxID=1975096 RepID=A0A2J0QBW4_9BACT|nr:MAG: 50S ribosomal protein L15 [Candidatus Yanofskybacteria bacterium CG10_big_fil_rev_8_21_14_0_10_36_16]
MQLHDIKSTTKKSRKRVGRGGKRGTYSGRGQKGQKSRSGASIRSDFRGGNAPVWRLFGKKRGVSKKVSIKHKFLRVPQQKPHIVNLNILNNKFNDGDNVSPKTLVSSGVIKNIKGGVKILNKGELTKKLSFSGVAFSNSAKEQILKTGSTIK